MKVDIIQTSFTGGEFGPSLYGRTDIAQYSNACQIVENMLPRSYGPVISMPGTRYVATVSDSTLRTRIIPFVFNRTDAYIIEMGDLYMRFFTDRGQVATKSGTENLSAFSANLIAHYKMNDNTNSTTVLDAVGSHSGSASTLTSSLSTTAIVSTGFDLGGIYHVSVPDHINFTRTASTQPMTILVWAYYSNNGSNQSIFSKSGEYELSVNSSDEMSFFVTSGDEDTKLLLHFDGTDTSTTFTDSSTGAKTMTAVGDAQIDTSESKFGGSSGLFDGSGDRVTTPDSSDFDFSTGNFTIDFWVKFNSVGSCDLVSKGTNLAGWDVVYANGTSELRMYGNGVNYASGGSSFSPSANVWYHIAIVRDGNTLRFFVNGSQVGTDNVTSANFDGSASVLAIGSNSAGSFGSFNGWMDELRIVKGTAVWTSGFTPSSIAYESAATNSWKVSSSITKGWHFFGIVFKGTGASSADCKIYIDGQLASSTFTADPSFVQMENTASLFRIGSSSSGGDKNWKSKLDNLAFIHQELTANEIASLYSSTSYQISTIFTENELFGVHLTQLNDIIWLTHPNHPPQKLIRTSEGEWTISEAPIIGGPFLDENKTSTTITPSATSGTINLTVTPTTVSLFTRSSSTLGHHDAYWMIGGLSQTNSTTGIQETGYVQITHVINGYTATATVIKNLKASSATTVWAEGAWSAVRGYPSKVTFQERRIWYGRTNYEPQKEWASKTFEYDNFALDTQADDDALNLPLASNESNEIQWLASGKSLVAGTFGGAFVTNSGSTEPITPDNVNASEEIGYGSESIMPKKIGSFIYYIQRFGKKLREMFFNWELDTYKAADRTILSPHILGGGVVDMAVQQNPETIMYCVLTNGTLATMTREVDQEVTAWARHSTSGTYTSIATIPSQTEDYDEAWVIVERWINGSQKKYVEFFENIQVPDRQDKCLYLHSALTYDAYENSSLSSCTISLSSSSGSITLTSSTSYFVSGNVGKRIRAIDSSGATLGEGQITAYSSATSITLSITTTFNSLSYIPGYWGISASIVSGLSHLESETVGILADGRTESLTRTVASGSLTLGSNYFVVHVGLSYNQIIYTLPKEAGSQRGTAQGKVQRINEISLKLNRSTQDFYYGPDSSNLDLISLAITPSVTTLYTGTIKNIAFRGGYHVGAQIYLKNSNPLPIEILSIISTLDTNDK